MSESLSACSPLDDPSLVLVGQKEGVTLFNHGNLDALMQLPLPGIVIFVHGVNSDGEWYEQAESGICKGLNERLKRRDADLAYNGIEAGQMFPSAYLPELDPDGYINPNMTSDSFIQTDGSFSPVIRFRWGYKASAEELKQFGGNIYLNEQNYWGGGPFANGCSTIPDLWAAGLDDQLFLWIHAQHINPTPDRQVFSCPARPYFVFAAYRLARLVESIRKKQADVPITIICHSQGNMVGICAAFLGDTFAPATDAAGRSSKCVADTYLLCNPPYSLLESNFAENWSQLDTKDAEGRTGRQTLDARTKTLAAFFDILRQRAPLQQSPARIDRRMGNPTRDFTAQQDRDKHGLNGNTYGRVTLYCNPHDQVISASPVQGIGWRGMSMEEIQATNGTGVFTQRVFAQDFEVGSQAREGRHAYRYWEDQYNHPDPKNDKQKFWVPESPPASYSLSKGEAANQHWVAKFMTFVLSPVVGGALWAAKARINGFPPEGWTIPLLAPPLDEPFKPQAIRFGAPTPSFDQGVDLPGEYRDLNRKRSTDDPYAQAKGDAKGDEASEASLRYEDHAQLRMQARQDGFANGDQTVPGEEDPSNADDKYKKWRGQKLKEILQPSIDPHATDHSTIVTNPMHAQRAMAYDLAIGCCDIRAEDLHNFRIAADWRFLKGLDRTDPNQEFLSYFVYGKFKNQSIFNWANAKGSEVTMPPKIVDERQILPPPPPRNDL